MTDEKPRPAMSLLEALRTVFCAVDLGTLKTAAESGEYPSWAGPFFYYMRYVDHDRFFVWTTRHGIKDFVLLADSKKESLLNEDQRI